MAAVIPTFTTVFQQGIEGQGATLMIYISLSPGKQSSPRKPSQDLGK